MVNGGVRRSMWRRRSPGSLATFPLFGIDAILRQKFVPSTMFHENHSNGVENISLSVLRVYIQVGLVIDRSCGYEDYPFNGHEQLIIELQAGSKCLGHTLADFFSDKRPSMKWTFPSTCSHAIKITVSMSQMLEARRKGLLGSFISLFRVTRTYRLMILSASFPSIFPSSQIYLSPVV